MSANSSIEWCDSTWNPTRGCSMASGSELGGCLRCYAAAFACRFNGEGQPYEGLAKRTKSGPRWTGEIALVEDHLEDPLHWRKPQRVFVDSMSDLFHEGVPDEWLDRVFAVMALAPQHTFMILTKRPERMLEYFLCRGGSPPPAGSSADITPALVFRAAVAMVKQSDAAARGSVRIREVYPKGRWPWPLPNVWMGVSCENQETAEVRIPILLKVPAAVRFISAEPLLAPIDLMRLATYRGAFIDSLQGDVIASDGMIYAACPSALDLVIVGGESGADARACDMKWIRSIVRQCRDAGTACFVKQLGAVPFDSMVAWRALGKCEPVGEQWRLGALKLRDKKGGDMAEWPEDLRVRQFPEGVA